MRDGRRQQSDRQRRRNYGLHGLRLVASDKLPYSVLVLLSFCFWEIVLLIAFLFEKNSSPRDAYLSPKYLYPLATDFFSLCRSSFPHLPIRNLFG